MCVRVCVRTHTCTLYARVCVCVCVCVSPCVLCASLRVCVSECVHGDSVHTFSLKECLDIIKFLVKKSNCQKV